MNIKPGFLIFWLAAGIGFWGPLEAKFTLYWPTPNFAFAKGSHPEAFVQPTESGATQSALFGCVRNNGGRFHEGIDLAPLKRDRTGLPTDPIFAAMNGRVVYLNRSEKYSSYGIYIVLEHPKIKPSVYTLYAHLRSIKPNIRIGNKVKAGDRLGIMGHTAGGYTIPSERAHLHFEMGLRLSDEFDKWFSRNDHPDPNLHGNFNGINLLGIDPLDFYEKYKRREVDSIYTYIKALPTAYRLKVLTSKMPAFLRLYPELMSRPIPPGTVVGWDIRFTWWGLPLGWTALKGDQISANKKGQVSLVNYDLELLKINNCRETIILTEKGPEIGNRAHQIVEILFGQL